MSISKGRLHRLERKARGRGRRKSEPLAVVALQFQGNASELDARGCPPQDPVHTLAALHADGAWRLTLPPHLVEPHAAALREGRAVRVVLLTRAPEPPPPPPEHEQAVQTAEQIIRETEPNTPDPQEGTADG